jgi:uncharacterized protein (TIGR03435 family)
MGGSFMRFRTVPFVLALSLSLAAQDTSAPRSLSGAQPPSGAQLEAATFKPKGLDGGASFQSSMMIDPSHIVFSNISLNNLITVAYGLQSDQLEAPDWTKSAYFDVDASFSGATTTKYLFLLLQLPLRNQFKLASHVETRNLRNYELVVAPSGIKMKLSERPEAYPTQSGPLGYRIHGAVMPMAFLAELLSRETDRPVVDKTNLQGNYEFNLDFVPDSMEMQPNPPDGPNLREALQEQLGLKLQSGIGPVPVLIVDHIERAPILDN